MTRTSQLFLSLGALAAFSLLPQSGEAEVIGVKAAGIGGAGVALPQEATSAVLNPAASAWLCSRIDLGLASQVWYKELTVVDRDPAAVEAESGHFHAKDAYTFFGVGGYNDWLSCNAAWNVSWTNEEYVQTHFNKPLTEFSGIAQTGDALGSKASFDYRVETLSVSTSYLLNECNTIGIGINAHLGIMRIAGLQRLTSSSEHPGAVTDRGTYYSVGFPSVTIGWLGRFSDCLTLGASYRSKASMGRYNKYKGFLPRGRIDLPQIWRLGAAYDIFECFNAALDFEYHDYNGINALTNRFPGDSTTGFGPLFGSADGPGLGWQSRWVVKTGLTWDLCNDWVLRAGYRHIRTPIRSNSTATVLNALTLQTVEDWITFGGTWDWGCESEFSFYGEYGFKKSIAGHIPSIGPGAIFASGDQTFKAQEWALGVAYGYKF